MLEASGVEHSVTIHIGTIGGTISTILCCCKPLEANPKGLGFFARTLVRGFIAGTLVQRRRLDWYKPALGRAKLLVSHHILVLVGAGAGFKAFGVTSVAVCIGF